MYKLPTYPKVRGRLAICGTPRPGPSAESCRGFLLYTFWRILPGIFLEDFSGHFFPTKMRRKNPATKSAKKSGASTIKIRKESALPKTDPNISGAFFWDTLMGFFKRGFCTLASGGGGWKGGLERGWKGLGGGVGKGVGGVGWEEGGWGSGLGRAWWGWGRVGEGLAFYASKTPFDKLHSIP